MCSELLITVQEAARRLGLGRSVTYRLIQREQLVSVKIGASRRIRVSDLEAFVRSLSTGDKAAE